MHLDEKFWKLSYTSFTLNPPLLWIWLLQFCCTLFTLTLLFCFSQSGFYPFLFTVNNFFKCFPFFTHEVGAGETQQTSRGCVLKIRFLLSHVTWGYTWNRCLHNDSCSIFPQWSRTSDWFPPRVWIHLPDLHQVSNSLHHSTARVMTDCTYFTLEADKQPKIVHYFSTKHSWKILPSVKETDTHGLLQKLKGKFMRFWNAQVTTKPRNRTQSLSYRKGQNPVSFFPVQKPSGAKMLKCLSANLKN